MRSGDRVTGTSGDRLATESMVALNPEARGVILLSMAEASL